VGLPTNQTPECLNDPSAITPKVTTYAADQGFQVPKTENNDACTSGTGSDHCWTEQWWVETEIVYEDWAVTGYAVDCNSTTTCESTTAHLGHSCTAHTTSEDNSFELGLTGRWDVDTKVSGNFRIDIGGGYSHTWTKGNTDMTCTTDSGSVQVIYIFLLSVTTYIVPSTCCWGNDKCHQIWQAQRHARIYGYGLFPLHPLLGVIHSRYHCREIKKACLDCLYWLLLNDLKRLANVLYRGLLFFS